jgi:predicted small lipoprotein YifL
MNRLIRWAVLGSVALAGCGQKGPLYLPNRGGTIVTRPPSSNSPATPSPTQTPVDQAPAQQAPTTAAPATPQDKDRDPGQTPK